MAKNISYTPGQINEALTWINNKCPALVLLVNTSYLDNEAKNLALTDFYWKLKRSSFTLKPNEFIVGVEYNDTQKVLSGEEEINFNIQKYVRAENDRYNYMAHEILLELFTRLKQ